MNTIVGPILTAIGLGITGILVAVIKSVGDVAIAYIVKKKETVEHNLQLDKHKADIETAKEVWNIIEEKYRITDNVKELVDSKAQAFDKMLLTKCSYLTEDEIADIRQAIAGEINKGKAMLNSDNLKAQATDLVNKNNALVQENAELKNKLNAIKNYVPVEEEQQ